MYQHKSIFLLQYDGQTLRPYRREGAYLRQRQARERVEVLDAETNMTYEFTAPIVFLNASVLNSTWVLMNSATDVWEGGLGSSSGELDTTSWTTTSA